MNRVMSGSVDGMDSRIDRAFGHKRLRAAVLAIVAIILGGSHGFAQDRGGLTALVDIGAGVQSDTAIEETEVGLAGLNFGVGGFLTRDLALTFRLSATNVRYDLAASGDYRQVSGVAGPALQWWVSDRLNLEAGAGFGFWSANTREDSRGLGLLVGAGVTLLDRGKHHLQVGIHYAPAITDPGTIHNVGFTFGYQLM
jgi:hypothetical protein